MKGIVKIIAVVIAIGLVGYMFYLIGKGKPKASLVVDTPAVTVSK